MTKIIILSIFLGLIFIFELPVCAFLSKSPKFNLLSVLSDSGGDSIASTSFKSINSIGLSIIKKSNHLSDTNYIGIINTYYIKSIVKILRYSNNEDTAINNTTISGSSKYCKIGDSITIYVNNILQSETRILTDNLLWSGTVKLSAPIDSIVVKITDNIKRTAYDTIIINYFPIIFSVIQPSDSSIIYDYTPNFMWNGNGDSYLILISRDFFATIYDSNIVTNTKYHKANIPANRYFYNNSYQWKVITYKNFDFNISPIYTFRIDELIGDFDNNNYVDDTDLILLRYHWYNVSVNLEWNELYNIVIFNPKRIDYRDLVLFSRYWQLGHRE